MKSQRGGFVMGLIVGLLVGLALALGVALYVTKVPVPFVNKVPQRTAEQDAAELEKNKNWDPNGPLVGKNANRPAPAASAVVTLPPAPPPPVAAVPPVSPPSPPPSTRDPAAILGERPLVSPPPGTPPPAPAPTSTRATPDPFTYFVQAGAYGRPEDAEQQRAKLAMLGMEARVTEREQAGRTVYRVRVGPYDRKEEADAAKERLDTTGVESALVRVQR
jgi:cell division protein FtsN